MPLATSGLKPADGQSVLGEIGILRGNDFQMLHRVCWNYKPTAIIADVPGEAELTPALWVRWQFTGRRSCGPVCPLNQAMEAGRRNATTGPGSCGWRGRFHEHHHASA